MTGAPDTCAHCGHPLGVGRFCTNCGAPVGSVPVTPYEPAHAAPASYGEPVADVRPEPPRSVGPALWVGAAAVLLVIVLVGGALLLVGGGGKGSAHQSPPLVPRPTHHHHSTASTSAGASTSASPSPSPQGNPGDVAALARASAPAHAPSGVDLAGNPVTFVAANLLDGSPETCWRRPGDASGTTITIRLDQPTRLTGVGLVNGYAKVAFSGGRRFDWYAGNRRVLAAVWVFDDGSSVRQRFTDTRRMQRLTIDPVTTSTVRLEIAAVSPPGSGPAARNDTAISEVSLIGTPG